MSIETADVGGRSAPSTSSVDPPPMSTTRTGASTGPARCPDGAGEDERRLLVAGQHLGRHAEPLANPGGEDLGVARRRGWRTWRRSGPGRRRAPAISAAYSSMAANVRASASSASRPVRVDALPEPDHPRLADRDVRAGRRSGA